MCNNDSNLWVAQEESLWSVQSGKSLQFFLISCTDIFLFTITAKFFISVQKERLEGFTRFASFYHFNLSAYKHKDELTSCEWESIWLAVRESSSDDSSESSWVILLRLGMLMDSWLSSRACRSLWSRLSMERLRTPQLKLSMVSPCNRDRSLVSKLSRSTVWSFRHKSMHAQIMYTQIHTTMPWRFKEGATLWVFSPSNKWK